MKYFMKTQISQQSARRGRNRMACVLVTCLNWTTSCCHCSIIITNRNDTAIKTFLLNLEFSYQIHLSMEKPIKIFELFQSLFAMAQPRIGPIVRSFMLLIFWVWFYYYYFSFLFRIIFLSFSFFSLFGFISFDCGRKSMWQFTLCTLRESESKKFCVFLIYRFALINIMSSCGVSIWEAGAGHDQAKRKCETSFERWQKAFKR